MSVQRNLQAWPPSRELTNPYSVRVSTGAEDRIWDGFVAATPGGRVAQTSMWARIKARLGWQSARVVVEEDGSIVAGGQLLVKQFPFGAAAGYVPRGPLMSRDDPAIARLLMTALSEEAISRGVFYLGVRPPAHYSAIRSELERLGFRPSLIPIEVEPTATVIVDLLPSPDELLAGMQSKTRYNVRLGQRKGIVVREGTEDDIAIFYRFLQSTAERQGFKINPVEYFHEVWRVLAPPGHLKLFLAEHEGEPLSGSLVLAIGDTATYWRGAWSGQKGSIHPNEVMHWSTMLWAKEQGLRYYDLEGIEPRAGVAADKGDATKAEGSQSLTTFKMGFGGEIVFPPGLYERLSNRLIGRAYTTFFPKVSGQPLVAKLVGAARGLDS